LKGGILTHYKKGEVDAGNRQRPNENRFTHARGASKRRRSLLAGRRAPGQCQPLCRQPVGHGLRRRGGGFRVGESGRMVGRIRRHADSRSKPAGGAM